MDLLGIVQSLHYEAKLAGTAPAGVASNSGRAADLVRWSIEAYNDIQRERDGKWKWLRGDFYVNTVADDGIYAYADCTDTDDAVAISRFRAWDIDEREPPLIYLSADGKSTEREMTIHTWTHFRYLFVRNTHTSAYPGAVSVDVKDNLRIGPNPDAVYRVTGNYWKSNQLLVNDSDTPDMPADYHMAIVYRAIIKYGYNSVSPEILARASVDGGAIQDALGENQAYSRFSLSTAEPLA